MIVTTAAGVAIPGSNGFRARYFTTLDGTGAPERSGPFATAFTRIDEQLHFEPGGNELPLNFFNDNSRFSYFQVRPRERNLLEFSVRWSGFWWVPGGAGEVYVDAPGATGEVFVDGEKQTGQLSLTPGWHRLDVTLSSPYGAPRRFSAGTMRLGVATPFDALSVYTQQIPAWQVLPQRYLRIVRTVCDLAAIGLILIVLALELWKKIAALRPARNRSRTSRSGNRDLRRRRGRRRIALRVALGDARDDARRRRRHADLRNVCPRHPVQRRPDERRQAAGPGRTVLLPGLLSVFPGRHALRLRRVHVWRAARPAPAGRRGDRQARRDHDQIHHRARVDRGVADRDRLHRLEVLAHRRTAAERIALRPVARRLGGGDDSALR